MPTTNFDGDSLATTHIFKKPEVTVISTAGDVVYTATQVIGGVITRDTNGAERTDTMPTAAVLVSKMVSYNTASATDSAFRIIIDNNGSHALNLVGGTGVSIYGHSRVEPGGVVAARAIVTSFVASSEAVSLYILCNKPTNSTNSSVSLRSVADILDGTYKNPAGSGTTWSNQTPIVFQASSYRYHLDGKDNSDYDTTDTSKSNLHVLFSASAGLFSSNGDKLRLQINWQNWAQGRLRLRFTDANYYATSGYADYGNTFALLLLNANTANGSMTLKWLHQDSSGTTVQDSVDVVLATRTAFSNSGTTPVLLDIERISVNELKVTLLDSNGDEFSGQSTVTCNTPSSIDTNSHSIDVDGVDHVLFEEISNSNIDVTMEKM